MTRLALVLGDQLFAEHAFDTDLVFMAEHPDLAKHYTYHSHKLVLFFAAMRSHADTLRENHKVIYHTIGDVPVGSGFTDLLARTVESYGVTTLVTYDIEDRFFEAMIDRFCNDHDVDREIIDSQGFLTTRAEFEGYRNGHKRIFQHEFYAWQRRRLGLLMDDGEPRGGKWSFDHENRKKLPKRIDTPQLRVFERTDHERDVITEVEERFANHPGDPEEFWLPTTRDRAIVWLNDFFEDRFERFGPYEDAISSQHRTIFHSVLSPLLNTGLLTPHEVIDRAIAYADEHDVHYPSLEGFVRQVIGWREFIRGVYRSEPSMQSSNLFGNDRTLTRDWYDATTGIPPLDDAIARAMRFGYLHHIERLMIVSNVMNLAGIHPDESYRWFMELFVDSADWVMVPNVYGMGMFADDTFATKPYVAGSNYLRKMSDYPKGPWCDTLDGLYWRFVERHREMFANNPRMSMILGSLDRMDDERRDRIFAAAERFVDTKTARNV